MADMNITHYRELAEDHEPNGWPAVQMHEITALVDCIDSLQAQLDEIRGIAGYPAKDELEKRGLSDSLADIIRCNHQRYMELTHSAEQREIAAQAQLDAMRK